MRTLFFLFVSLTILSCSSSEQEPAKTTSTEVTQSDSAYDPEKAAKYGADDYGMKKYVFAFLRKGPNRNLDSATSAELQRAHLQNINRMAEEGKLVLAGPFFGDGDLRGIYVFNVPTITEAEELTNTDPAIQQGSLVMELMEWYGSAALMEIGEIHKTLSKEDIVSD